MGNTRAGAGEKINFRTIKLYAVRVPHIIAGPAQIFGILARSAAEFVDGLGDILVIFGQMGVQHHAFVTRQNCGIAHQFAADGKW